METTCYICNKTINRKPSVIKKFKNSLCSTKCKSEYTKYRMSLPEVREDYRLRFSGKNNPFYGRKHSKESLEKMSKIKIGKHPSEEARRKMGLSHKGKMNKDSIEKLRRRMIILNNGENNPMKKLETRMKLSETMKRLYSEGKIKSWIKGLTKETDERVRKGVEDSVETRKKLYDSGKLTPWNKGLTKDNNEILKMISDKSKNREFSEETKKKISLANKGCKAWIKGLTKETDERVRKGAEKTSETRIKLYKEGKLSTWNKGKTHYEDERILAEEKATNWQGGKSFEPYGLEFNKQLKEQIRQRDNYRCQQCFRHQDELFRNTKAGLKKCKLMVHHIDFNKKNNNSNNLISLCTNCHIQTNFNREGWIKYFQDRIQSQSIFKESI